MEHDNTSCAHCGAPLQGDYSFCPACGHETGQTPQQPDTALLLREVRSLRELHARAAKRLQALESALAGGQDMTEEPGDFRLDPHRQHGQAAGAVHEHLPDSSYQSVSDTPAHGPASGAEPKQDGAAGDAGLDVEKEGEAPGSDTEFVFLEETPQLQKQHRPAPAPSSTGFRYGPADRPHQPAGAASAPSPNRPGPPPRLQTQKAPRESFESALGQKWLLAVGVVVIVFGLGYFLKYTFDQGWIGPAGQLALGYVFSLALLGGGEYARRRGYSLFGLWILGGGMASVYAATFAGHRVLELMPQGPSFGVLAAVTVATVGLAVLHNAPGLAVLGLLGGYLTPFVLEGLDDNMFFLLGFVTVLNAGVLAVSLLRRWNGLNWMGLAASYVIFAYWHLGSYFPSLFWEAPEGAFWVSLIFVNLTFLGYATAPLLGCLLPSREQGEPPRRGLTACAWLGAVASYVSGLFTVTSIDERFALHWAALPILGYAAVFAGLAWLAERSLNQQEQEQQQYDARHLSVLRGHAALFFLFAAPLAFNAHWVTTCLALQGALLVWLSQRPASRSLQVMGQVAVLFALARLLLVDLEDSWGLVTHTGLENLQGALYTYYGGFSKMILERWLSEGLVLASLGFAAWCAGYTEYGRQAEQAAQQEADAGVITRRTGAMMRLAFGWDPLESTCRHASLSIL